MKLSDLAPNWDLLRQPWNWFVVAFALIILILLAHLFLKDRVGTQLKDQE